MKESFIYKGLELNANINGYATYNRKLAKLSKHSWWRFDTPSFFKGWIHTKTLRAKCRHGVHRQPPRCFQPQRKCTPGIACSAVREVQSGDIILKVTNLLPVEINLDIEFLSGNSAGSAVEAIVLPVPRTTSCQSPPLNRSMRQITNCRLTRLLFVDSKYSRSNNPTSKVLLKKGGIHADTDLFCKCLYTDERKENYLRKPFPLQLLLESVSKKRNNSFVWLLYTYTGIPP